MKKITIEVDDITELLLDVSLFDFRHSLEDRIEISRDDDTKDRYKLQLEKIDNLINQVMKA